MEHNSVTNKRLATLEAIHKELLPQHIQPVPCLATVRRWLDREKVPRIKTNPAAHRGGGLVYYSVPAVEKLLRGAFIPTPRNPGGAQ